MGKGFKKTAFISCSISVSSVIVGIIVSFIVNIAPSGAVVLTETLIFLVILSGRYIIKKTRQSELEIGSRTESQI